MSDIHKVLPLPPCARSAGHGGWQQVRRRRVHTVACLKPAGHRCGLHHPAGRGVLLLQPGALRGCELHIGAQRAWTEGRTVSGSRMTQHLAAPAPRASASPAPPAMPRRPSSPCPAAVTSHRHLPPSRPLTEHALLLQIFAPGTSVLSAGITSDVASAIMSGTSMASVSVAGAVAGRLRGVGPLPNHDALPVHNPSHPSPRVPLPAAARCRRGGAAAAGLPQGHCGRPVAPLGGCEPADHICFQHGPTIPSG